MLLMESCVAEDFKYLRKLINRVKRSRVSLLKSDDRLKLKLVMRQLLLKLWFRARCVVSHTLYAAENTLLRTDQNNPSESARATSLISFRLPVNSSTV